MQGTAHSTALGLWAFLPQMLAVSQGFMLPAFSLGVAALGAQPLSAVQ